MSLMVLNRPRENKHLAAEPAPTLVVFCARIDVRADTLNSWDQRMPEMQEQFPAMVLMVLDL